MNKYKKRDKMEKNNGISLKELIYRCNYGKNYEVHCNYIKYLMCTVLADE